MTLDAVDVVGSLGHAPPTLTGVDPTSGGASVTITGAGFTDVTAVTFGGAPAAGYQVESSTRIVAVPPAITPGTVDVVVATAWGSSDPSGAADDYTILARHEQTDSHIVYEGSWGTFYKSFASGGSYGRSSTSGPRPHPLHRHPHGLDRHEGLHYRDSRRVSGRREGGHHRPQLQRGWPMT